MRLALIPLANRSANNAALERATALIGVRMPSLGYELVDRDSLRNQMRLTRMRLSGEIDSASAEKIRESMAVDLILTGALEMYSEQENPEAGLCLRIYDCRTHRITWVGCEFATGEDFAGLFGVGRLTDVAALSEKVIDKLTAKMPMASSDNRRQERKQSKRDKELMSAGKIAVVPFDNSSDFPNADGIATDIMLQELWQRGFELLEPGELNRLQSQLNVEIHGGISDVALAAIREQYQLSVLVTGSIAKFEPTRTAVSDIVPQMEVSLRLIDPATGSVSAAVSLEHDGSQWETLFGMGRINSIGRLGRRSLHDGWSALLESRRERAKALAAKSDSNGETNASK